MVKSLINRTIAIAWWFYTIPRQYDVERRSSLKYKRKKEIVKKIWLVAAVIMAILAQYPLLIGGVFCVALFTTFLAFMILDETE